MLWRPSTLVVAVVIASAVGYGWLRLRNTKRFNGLYGVEINRPLDPKVRTDPNDRIHHAISPPEPNSYLTEYTATFSDDDKVVDLICGQAKEETESRFALLKEALIAKYGKPDKDKTEVDFAELLWTDEPEYAVSRPDVNNRELSLVWSLNRYVEVCVQDKSIDYHIHHPDENRPADIGNGL